ncbi:Transcriptional activator [Mortierella sp. AM989]|nr:Transcriptional activator [Mortierella sp. AM989]
MTQPSRVTSPPSQQDYASHSPRQHNISSSSSSSPHHVESRSAGMHHFEHIAGAYPGVIVVDPSMMPPGYVIGQVAARVEEPEEPLYVNAKQYHRILKRRAARANLEAQNRLLQRGRKFMHESRHLHAMRRPRGPGGRFLTAAEIAALDSKSPTEDEDTNDHHHNHQHNQHHNNNSNDNSNSSSNNSAYNSIRAIAKVKINTLYHQQLLDKVYR